MNGRYLQGRNMTLIEAKSSMTNHYKLPYQD